MLARRPPSVALQPEVESYQEAIAAFQAGVANKASEGLGGADALFTGSGKGNIYTGVANKVGWRAPGINGGSDACWERAYVNRTRAGNV